MRALKVTGDATKQEDYESCKSRLLGRYLVLMSRAIKGSHHCSEMIEEG